MRTPVLVLLVTIAVAAAGCGSEDVPEEAREATTALTDTAGAAETAEEALEDVQSAIEDARTLDLKEQNNSGMSGTVAVTPTSEGDVEVEIELEGSEGDRIRRTSTPGRARTSIRSRNGRSRTS